MTGPFETRLRRLAQEFDYPHTPQVADRVMKELRAPAVRRLPLRRLAQGLLIAFLLLASLMAVPPVRAAVLEFIQIGIVRILPPRPADTGTVEAPVTATPLPPSTGTVDASTPSLLPFLDQVAGETTLAEARGQVDFPIPLPQSPVDLGQPAHVYVQDANGWMVVLVWLDPQDPARIHMSLHLIESGSWAIEKVRPTIIQETTVHGLRALWTEGDYPLLLRDRNIVYIRLVKGHVLIWEQAGITYRLESDLSLEEAVRTAESLQTP